jgi:hypothetical protein
MAQLLIRVGIHVGAELVAAAIGAAAESGPSTIFISDVSSLLQAARTGLVEGSATNPASRALLRVEATATLSNQALDLPAKRDEIRDAGGIPVLMELARGTGMSRDYAVRALQHLALDNPRNEEIIRAAGGQKLLVGTSGVGVLVGLARDGTDEQKEGAAKALSELVAGNGMYKELIRSAGGIHVLVGLAKSGTAKQKENASRALTDVALENRRNRTAVRECGGIAVLVGLAGLGTDTEKEIAAGALAVLALGDPTNQDAIREVRVPVAHP